MDQSNLTAVTQGSVWTLTANDLHIKKDCLDNLGSPSKVLGIERYSVIHVY